MPLNDTAIRNAKPREKSYKLFDSEGLYLEVAPSGGKWWRLKYRIDGKEKRISLGVYPKVSLKKARLNRNDSRKFIDSGIDPSIARKIEKDERKEAVKNSFESIAREWHLKYRHSWSKSHGDRIIKRLESNIFPWLGKVPIADITPKMLLKVLRKIENRGAIETAHRVKAICGQVFRYGVATDRVERDPSADLKGAIPPSNERHHPSITDTKAIGELLRAIDGYEGSVVTLSALKLAPLVFVRPGELRHAEWSEIDIENTEWRIPAEKMKSKQIHIVPLSSQAVDIFSELQPVTGFGKYVFPGVRSSTRPMSNNTVNAALRRLGYSKDEMTGYGFHSIASTLLNEQGWNHDAIERQLAHTERNKVRAAYNYAEYLPERREMMQAWSDYLDGLKSGAKVVPIKKKA